MFRLVAVLALGLGLWAYVHQARLAAFPPDLDLSGLTWPVRVECVKVGSEDQARFQAESHAVEQEILVASGAGETEFPAAKVILVPAYSRPYLLVTLISGLFFWSVAALVFAPRVNQPAVHLFFWISLLYGTGVLVGGVFGQSWPLGFAFLRPLLQLASLAFLPATFLHLSLAFPSPAAPLVRRPWLPVFLYLIATVLVIWQAMVFLGYFRNPGPAAWARLAPPQVVADGLMVLQVVAGFSVLVRRASRLADARQRQQGRWLILGFLIGSAPYVFLRTLPNLFGAPALLPAYVDRILELAVPTAFVFAVVRYRFLDIDIILRRGLIYGFLAAVLTAVVVLPVLLLGPSWSDPWPWWWRLVVMSCGLLAGILFRPLHMIIGRGVDRTFFKIEREMADAVGDYQAALDTATDPQDLVEILLGEVEATLHLEPGAVLVVEGAEIMAAGQGDLAGVENWWLQQSTGDRPPASFLCAAEVWAEVGSHREPMPPLLTEAGFIAVMPLTTNNRSHGAVFLRPKLTGRLFLAGDLDFLERAAELAARRLEQMLLARTAAGELRKRRQLDELSRLKDDFLSRVAHDLRTPVTSMGWSIRNLDDGLAGELNQKQKDYLSSIRDAVDHLAGLVTNLLEISRLEESKVEVACGPLDPSLPIFRAIGTVKPLAEARGVTLDTGLADSDPVLANDDKLAEVLVNLLENAVRYSPRGGTVTVTTEKTLADRILITVRDQGPGLKNLADPFGRFVQGTPNPDGERGGYGLGLTIAREYVVLMGGTIEGTDHPEGGAVFTIELKRPENQTGGPP